MRPEAAALRRFLALGVRRVRTRSALFGAAIGAVVGAAIGALTFGAGTALVVLATIAAGAILGAAWAANTQSPLTVVATFESHTPASRNLVRTACELLEGAIAAPPHVTDRIYRDAAALVNRADAARLWPLRRAIGVATVAVIASAAIAGLSARKVSTVPAGAQPTSQTAALLSGVDIEVTPPAYSGRHAVRSSNPSRIDALAGSRIRVTANADAAHVTLTTISRSQELASMGARAFSGELLADADGYLALTPVSTQGTSGVRRLIGLTITPDRAPRVRVTAPGRDLLAPNGARTLQLSLEADDDLALNSLGVKFTRIAGSGESFTFTEGTVRVDVTATSEQHWQGRASWPLAPLTLEPGDMVIYRGIATDKRPGAPAAESDPFIVEIAAGGSLPSEGFAIDDRENKYAISQQMVIVKTERLLAARKSMPDEDFRSESSSLASEQRQVRAEFVFMMGGELADAGIDLSSLNEEVEAAGEADLAAGRLANQGRLDLLRAIRSMSRAAARLADPDPAGALPLEKEALTYLQRAFTRSRYILRTLSERERLDLSRRLTGTLAALTRDTRPAAETPVDPRTSRLRRALADLAALASESTGGSFGARASVLAQSILDVDPQSTSVREAASAVLDAAAATGQTRIAALDRAAAGLAALIRTELGRSPQRSANPDVDALAGALADALRRGGRTP